MKPSLTEQAWEWIELHGREVHFVRGDRLMLEGERADHVYAIASGEVKALAESRSGNAVLIAMIGPDQAIGLLSAFDKGPREFSAIARNNVTAWQLSRSQYLGLLIELPAVGEAQLEAIATRFRLTLAMCVGRSDDLTCRISRRLNAMAAEHRSPELELTQSELASWVGASREATVRCLGRLRASGAIETHRGGITVLNSDRLSQFLT
ncbi:MAG: Crp/Fnr family transcriptional regulator [Acidimicrobiales bacterium]